MNKINHHYEFDIMRIVGILSIVLYHYTFRGYAADNMSGLQFPVLGSIFKYGGWGIYIFFILSGYTIVLSAYNKKFSTFIFARITRLYPSFWASVCLTAVATLLLGGERFHVELKQFLVNLTMLSGFLGVPSVDGAYWFLFVILKFYFLIAILIFFNLLRFQEYVAGIWLALAFLITFYDIPHLRFFLIPEYAPFLISGMIFYSARNTGWNFYKLFLIAVSLLFSFYLVMQIIPDFELHYKTHLSLLVSFLFIMSIYMFMFWVSISKRQIKLPAVFITLGACTYPLYLIHQNIGFMIFNSWGSLLNRDILLTLTLLLMISLSVLIVTYVDPYLGKYKKRMHNA